MLLLVMRQHDRNIQGCWPLQCHIHTQWLAEAGDEELYLMCLDDRRVAVGQPHEVLGKVIY
jgi:hypothetical protein